MFTIVFSDHKGLPLYEQLYTFIRQDIESGVLKAEEKLPSQRKLAAHLNISRLTVENAYAQLISEGYLVPKAKQGYFVSTIDPIERVQMPVALSRNKASKEKADTAQPLPFDLRTNKIGTEHFPYSIWSRLMRTNMRTSPSRLLETVHPQGDEDLREEIALHLHKFRGMMVDPSQILIGAGTEYLMGLITEILQGAAFGVEDPGYPKIPRILKSRRAKVYPVPLDKEGMRVDALAKTDADVAVITPSHQFPLGVVMSIGRRQSLLKWVYEKNERYLIEDDYNSEFHFALKPIPTLYSLDQNNKVVYLNSFANTLAPSLRIAYMVLPRELLEQYQKTLYFYSCTVSAFEQHTLRMFMQEGYYERHVNRMRKIYRNRQTVLVEGLAPLGKRLRIEGQSAGLHLLLRLDDMAENDLVTAAARHGVSVAPISGFYFTPEKRETHTVVAGFSGCRRDVLRQAAAALSKAWVKFPG